jgi:prepilin-type N-terminal cleavage/methylation domain-containing protein
MPKINYKKGFTLIELLVVIAIVGLLSGIVLTFINSARMSAKDARIKTNVKSIKTQLDVGFNGIRYIDLRANSEVPGLNQSGYLYGYTWNCVPPKFGSSIEACKSIMSLMDDTVKQGGDIIYRINSKNGDVRATDFAIYGKLSSDGTQYFCLDSVGGSKQKTSIINSVTCQ